jgi:ABC-2 type transport system permease protein
MIAGKSVAVCIVVVLQAGLLGVIGFALGWRPTVPGLALGAAVIALGTVMFAAMGILLGGTLKAEIVLALANILWFVMLAFGSLVLLSRLPHAAQLLVRIVPSGALAHALENAVTGVVDWFGLVVLTCWAIILARLATRLFRFT